MSFSTNASVKKNARIPTCPCQINYPCSTGTLVVCCFDTYDAAAAYLAGHPMTSICPIQ